MPAARAHKPGLTPQVVVSDTVERPACSCGGRDGRLPSRPTSQPTQPPSWGCPRARRATQTTVCRGKFPLGGSVGRMVGLPVESGRGIDFLSSSALSRAVCACWPSGFCQSPKQVFLGVSGPCSCLVAGVRLCLCVLFSAALLSIITPISPSRCARLPCPEVHAACNRRGDVSAPWGALRALWALR